MKLYIDADAFPNLLKPILLRAIERLKISTIVIANKRVNIGVSEYVSYIIVNSYPDEADNFIVELLAEDDLVITADIPLADRVISKKAHAINHHGKHYTTANIKHYLAMRNLMQELRDNGAETKGSPPFTQKDAHEFANQFDKFMTKQKLI